MQVISYCLLSAPLLQAVAAGPVLQSLGRHGVTQSFGVPGINATFDYVVVGGGTAGLTIASRLAADSSISVAVIEAGGFYEAEGNTSVVPGYCTLYAGTDPADTYPSIDWNFMTVPQAVSACFVADGIGRSKSDRGAPGQGANHRRLHYARGKTLGGSSARNFLYYHRQTVGSAQKWADDTRDQSYTFSNFLPYYQKSVNYTGPTVPYPNSTNDQDLSAFSAPGGPLQVSHGSYNDPFATWILPALQAIGQKAIDGFQSGILLGSAYVLATIDPTRATRASSESSFLQDARASTTLRVYNNTLAKRLLFADEVARGVLVSSQGNEENDYVLSARKEIIVSAGAFQSPQLLMVSGIGPRKTLDGLGIPVIKDLPGVGQNLWDHAFYGTTFRVNIPTASAGLNSKEAAAAAVEAYLDSATGPLSVPGTMVLGWENLPPDLRRALPATASQSLESTFPTDWPHLEFLPLSGALGNQSNYQLVDPRDGYNYASVATSIVAPLSRGEVSINSSSMADPPLINPNWLTHPTDIQLAIAAFKRQRQVWAAMSNLTIGPEQIPGPAVQSDADILDFIRRTLAPVWHAAATCKMGHRSDRMAVIDTNARVYGVQGLRVVDASSFPFLPPGHPQATVYALAEKIADEILRGMGESTATSKD
ncbi:MAG: hypothetical protein Q9211_004674 [Gyalolechia sp. 1 TL-2023]